MADEPVQVTAAHLRIIHAALIAGVLLFAGVVAVVVPSGSPEPLNALRLVWLGAAAGAMVAAGIVSGRQSARADSTGRARSAIILWAIGEGPALLGLAFSFVTGDRLLLVLPVVVFLLYMMRYRPGSFTAVRESE